VVALIVLSRQRPRKEHSADRSAELMRFRKRQRVFTFY